MASQGHVWVLLTEKNRLAYEAALKDGVPEYCENRGLSGFHDMGGLQESTIQVLGTVDTHHEDWTKIVIHGAVGLSEVAKRVEAELGVGPVVITRERGNEVICRAS